MQNVMRIARAISKRRKDSCCLEVGDLATAFYYVDFVDRRTLGNLCRWLELDADVYRSLRSGGQVLANEGMALVLPLSKALRERMDCLPISLESIVGSPSDGEVDTEEVARWVLAGELEGCPKPVPNRVDPVRPARKSVPVAAPKPTLRERLAQAVFGQDDVLDEVAAAVGEHERGTQRLPLSMLLAGPAASGKTLLAEKLAAELEGYAVRSFEMSAYRSPQDFGLTGLRYGWADAHPGELTSFVRHNKRSVVVFENIDRAHPVIQDTLVPAVVSGVLRDEYWAGLCDRSGADALSGLGGMGIGRSSTEPLPGKANPDVDFADCILIFTTGAGESVYDLPIYNERDGIDLAGRGAMLLDALRGGERGGNREPAISPGLLNALATSSILPLRRLDSVALNRIALACIRKAAERWRDARQCALRIEAVEQIAELMVLSLGYRANARALTVKEAEGFLFDSVDFKGGKEGGKRLTIAFDPEAAPAFAAFRESLGSDLALELFRKRRIVVSSRRCLGDAREMRLLIGGFRLEAAKSAFDYGGHGGLQVEMPEETFDDVVGHAEAKQRLRQTVRLLQRQHELRDLGVDLPRGLMLYGPPGTGKTMLAKAFSHEADMPFVAVTGTEMMDPDFVRGLFRRLRRYAPAILFIDEIDALGRRGQSALGDAVINQLLAEIDGFSSALGAPLFVVVATNYPEKLDPALLRSGRIDLQIEVPTLGEEARQVFFERYRAIPGLGGLDAENLLAATSGLSGADLEKLRRETVLEMARLNLESADEALLYGRLAEIKHGQRRDLEYPEAELLRAAVHEAGHAVLSQCLLPGRIIERIAVEARGNALGGVSYAIDDKRVENYDAERVRRQLCILLAGRAAEMHRFGECGCNAGAVSDLKQATELASRAVLLWGLDEALGMVALCDGGEAIPPLSQMPEWAVSRVRFWLDQAFVQAREEVAAHWREVDAVAEALLRHRTLSGRDWSRLWAGIVGQEDGYLRAGTHA